MSSWEKIREILGPPDEDRPEITTIRRLLLDRIVAMFAIVGTVAVSLGAWHAYSQGVWYFSVVYLVFYGIFLAAVVLVNKLSFKVRLTIHLTAFFVVAVAALLRLGLSGVGLMLLICVCGITAVLRGIRAGLWTIVVSLIAIAAIGTAMVTGVVEISVERMSTSIVAMSWLSGGVVFAMVVLPLIVVYQVFQKNLIALLEHQEGQTKALQRSNEQLRDEIERRETAETACQESEQRYRSIFDTTPVAIWEEDMSDLAAIVDDFKNEGVEDFETYMTEHPEFIVKVIETIEVLDVNNASLKMYKAENKEDLIQSLDRVFMPESIPLFSKMVVAFSKGERSFGFEGINRTLDGERLDVLVGATLPPPGQVPCIAVVSIMDVTERKRLEERLRHSEKMEAIGTLAGGIAHDFNNLLMGIQGCASLMQLKTDENHPGRGLARSIEELVDSGSHLTGQLLGFARRGKYDVRPADLNELVKSSASVFGRARKEIRIHQKLAGDIWTVAVDRRQVEQALLNLYVNAWQAMPDGGDLFLETTNFAITEEKAQVLDVSAGNFVRLSVTDTGIGMNDATRERVFEPFFTTKEMERGTGLGLASVFGIMTNHGGAVSVESDPGEGSTFTLFFPSTSQEEQPAEGDQQSFADGDETILLVDDETSVLHVSKEMLEVLGYKVLAASDGREALRLFEKEGEALGLVILDMVMPEMGGAELFEKFREIREDTPVLLSSGYSLDEKAEELLERGCRGFIQKPFGIEKLSKKVREVLDE